MKHSIILFSLLFSIQASEKEEKHFQLQVEGDNAQVVALVNGVELVSDAGTMIHSSYNCSHWIVNGKNALSLHANIPDSLRSYKKHEVIMRLISASRTKKSMKIDTIVNYIWNFPGEKSVTVDTAVSFALPYADWIWIKADSLATDKIASYKKNLTSTISNIYNAFVNKDYAKLAPYLEIKSTEMAQAHHIDNKTRLSDQKQTFEEIFTDKKFEMEPLELAKMQFRITGNGRLLEVFKGNNEPLIKSKALADDMIFSLEMTFCLKDGQWILVR